MIRWAPLSIPRSRRLQTGAICFALACFPAVWALLFAALFFKPFVQAYSREILVTYLLWQWLLDRNTAKQGGRPSAWVRGWRVWRAASEYFPARLHTPATPYTPHKPHIFCLHPHGVISVAAVANFIWEANEPRRRLGVDYRVATVSFNFLLPVWRDLLMALGFVDVSRSSIHHLLTHGTSVMIVVGGAQETLHARPGSADLVLKKRRGFVRLALEHGASLVPVYHFGENDLYGQFNNPVLRKMQDLAIKVLGFTIPVIRGRGMFQYDWGFLPRRLPLHTVMGDPLEVPRIENPSAADIDKYHALYTEALEKLYNTNKDKYYHPTDFHGRPIKAQPMRIVA